MKFPKKAIEVVARRKGKEARSDEDEWHKGEWQYNASII